MAAPDNMILVLPRETRQEFRDEITRLREETNARFDKVDKRLDVTHPNGMKARKGFIGHRTMVDRTMAHFDDQVSRPEQRVAALEAARP